MEKIGPVLILFTFFAIVIAMVCDIICNIQRFIFARREEKENTSGPYRVDPLSLAIAEKNRQLKENFMLKIQIKNAATNVRRDASCYADSDFKKCLNEIASNLESILK